MSSSASLQDRWPALAAVPPALAWLSMRVNLGLAHRTIDAYARGLSEYLAFSAEAADDQEGSVHALHLLQSCPVQLNRLMLQRVLADPAWMARMTSADIRGLTPLVWGHVSPYGTFDLDMEARLNLDWREAA